MKSIQYTIRSIPPKVDRALRIRAHKTGKSLNEVAIEALAKGAGIVPGATFNDLDWFIGNKSLDESFSEAMEWLDNAPMDIR
ncbi:MAG: FitA-like ribbon-helix-helix domain-containing protein [Acidimicrobiales bacterium]